MSTEPATPDPGTPEPGAPIPEAEPQPAAAVPPPPPPHAEPPKSALELRPEILVGAAAAGGFLLAKLVGRLRG